MFIAGRVPSPRTLRAVTALLIMLCRSVGATDAVVMVPDTPAGRQLAWFVASLNAGEVLRASSVSDHFVPAPFQQPAGIIRGFELAAAAMAPVGLVGFQGTPAMNELVAVVRDRDGVLHRLALATDPQQGHRIDEWSIRPGEAAQPNEIAGMAWQDARSAPLTDATIELVDGTSGGSL